MVRILLFGILLAAIAPGAQAAQLIACQDASGQDWTVSPQHPCSIAIISGGSGGTSSVNLAQVGGVTINLGQTTMSASLPVTIASDQTVTTQLQAQAAGVLVGGFNLYVGGAANSATNPAFVAQPDARQSAATLNAATLNATIVAALNNGEGVVGWTVSGLTASGATLTAEGSNDGGTTWSAINTTAPGTGALSTTVTADGQFRVNGGGHTAVRLRVSTVGTGTISVSTNASSVSSLVALSAPLPSGGNTLGAAWPAPTTLTVTRYALTANADQAVTAANATRKYLDVLIYPAACLAYLGFGTAAAVGAGPGYGQGGQFGYGEYWRNGSIPNGIIHVITANAGCSAEVREGN